MYMYMVVQYTRKHIMVFQIVPTFALAVSRLGEYMYGN